MTELSPYHRALRQDLLDYESMRRGLDAIGRISGISVDDALASIVMAATPEQRERVIKRCERGEEFLRRSSSAVNCSLPASRTM
jgi:hypothetical protein